MGGLAAAIALSSNGYRVKVFDRQGRPGGKARLEAAGAVEIDAGPTVLTMRWAFDQLFEAVGDNLSSHLQLKPIDVLARHKWQQGGQLDLFADGERSVEAIADFAGKSEADGYRAFCRDSAEIYNILLPTFICNQRPSMFDLVRRVGPFSADLWKLRPYATLWSSLRRYFSDPRLQQLFGRYATYCGSSPMRSPATLMLVAHAEQQGVWAINGGVHALASALRDLAATQGAQFRFDCEVTQIVVKSGRVTGVELPDGEYEQADAVIFNGDAMALNDLVASPSNRPLIRPYRREARSLSAMTWCINGRSSGFPLNLHNVFFASDYPSEFRTIFSERSIPMLPTVYVCAQDRGGFGEPGSNATERLLLIVNAPADGDRVRWSEEERQAIQDRVFSFLSSCGLEIECEDDDRIMTTPNEFEMLFPETGGALYGRATHGPFASFARPGSSTALTGLYLAGGSAHPGPGMPMAAMSGRLAAAKLMSDNARPTAIPVS